MASKGYQCVLSVGGSTIAVARDVTVKCTFTEQDVTSRASSGWGEAQSGIKRVEITGNAIYATDSGLSALIAANHAGTVVAFSATKADGAGYSGFCLVPDLSEGQQIDNAVMIDFTLRSTGTVTLIGATTTTAAATTTAGA